MSYDFAIGCRLIKPIHFLRNYPEYEENTDMQFEIPVTFVLALQFVVVQEKHF